MTRLKTYMVVNLLVTCATVESIKEKKIYITNILKVKTKGKKVKMLIIMDNIL